MLQQTYLSEKQALIELTRGDCNYQDLSKNKIDWEWLVSESLRHNISPVIGHWLVYDKKLWGQLPAKVREQLVYINKAEYKRYENQKKDIKMILDGLNQENIKAIVLKGPTLVELYPKPHLRVFCDLDILVSEYDVKTTRDVLFRLGWNRSMTPELDLMQPNDFTCHWGWYYDVNKISAERIKICDTTGIDTLGLVSICATQHLSFGPMGMVDTGEWLENAKLINICGSEVFTLSEEDQLLYLCTHLYRHFAVKNSRYLRFLLDIYLLAKKGINWPNFLDNVHRYDKAGQKAISQVKQKVFSYTPKELHKDLNAWYDSSRIIDQVHCALVYVNEIYGTIIPSNVLDATRPHDRTMLDAVDGPDGKTYSWTIPYWNRVMDFPRFSDSSFEIAKESGAIKLGWEAPNIPLTAEQDLEIWRSTPRIRPKSRNSQ